MKTFSDPSCDLSPSCVADILARGQAHLIDVREPYEYAAGHIENARHIPLEHLAANADAIPRDRPVVFQCRIGARSAIATQGFRAAGYDAYNMTGGLQAWADAGLPLAPAGGSVAAH
jgi:rhodanese-related sulfurtransferase